LKKAMSEILTPAAGRLVGIPKAAPAPVPKGVCQSVERS